MPQAPRDASDLALGAQLLAGLLALLIVGSALLSIPVASRIGGGLSYDDLPIVLVLAYTASALITIPALIGAWLTTGLWLLRVRRNSEVLAPAARHSRRAGWGLWSWITPFVSLWFPFQVVRDAHASTGRRLSLGVRGWWWASWLLMLLFDRTTSRLLDRLEPGDDPGAIVAGGVLTAAVTVLALVLWVRIVRDLSRGQGEQLRTFYARGALRT